MVRISTARRRTRTAIRRRFLDWNNRRSETSILGHGPVVSLTSHGERIESCHLTIESIAQGAVKPSRVVLWLDDPATLASLPPSLDRLRGRGLDVQLSDNFGPHTKYFPFVSQFSEHWTEFVTADDDVLYPPSWLKRLTAAAAEDPTVGATAHRAHKIKIAAGRIRPYDDWESITHTKATFEALGTGVSGVLYSADAARALAAAGTGFLKAAPRADDIWIHHTLLREGLRTRQVARRAASFDVIPESHATGLWRENVGNSRNDEYVRSLYTNGDVARILGEVAALH